MRTFLILTLTLYLTSHVRCAQINIVELGTVEGSTTTSSWTNRTIYQFMGIRFGLAPSGNRRFMPPEPALPWDGVYDATKNGIECPQFDNLNEIINAPPDKDMEDCLLLNLFTPKIPDSQNRSELLPVMVYIHGGGFYEGSARPFPPNYLLEKDIVLVVPQYRLGPLGFLSLETDNIPGNVGFLDQLLALKWVNKYIHYFGGDNSRVTIFGQSAGACSVSFHLISPLVEPYLFQQAIIHSGSSHADWTLELNPREYAMNLYTYLTNSTVEVGDDEMEADFKNVGVFEFMMAIMRQVTTDVRMQQRVGDAVIQKAGTQKYLTELPKLTLMKGQHRTLPMIAGVTKNDGSFLLTAVYDMLEGANLLNDDIFRHNLTYYVLEASGLIDESNTLVDTFNDVYFNKLFSNNDNLTFGDVAPGYIDILGNAFLKAQTLKQAKINSMYENSTYLYTFDYRGEHTRFGYGADTTKYPFDGGVHHSDDLLYLYPFPYQTTLNEEDTKIAQLMTELWTSFATNGKPTSSLLNSEWPTMKSRGDGPYLHIKSIPSIGDDFISNEYKITSREAGLVP